MPHMHGRIDYDEHIIVFKYAKKYLISHCYVGFSS